MFPRDIMFHVSLVLLLLFNTVATLAIPLEFKKLAPSIVCIRMCTDVFFHGQCKDFCGSPGMCYNVDPEFDNRISSARPQKGQVSGCNLFPEPNCTGRVNLEGIRYPGYDNFLKQSFNDVTSSWICY